MKREEIKPGTYIHAPRHPEYGKWVVRRAYGDGAWEIARSGRGSDEVWKDEDELLNHWEVVG